VQWYISGCITNWHDVDPNAPGCEYFNVTTGYEKCDGIDNDSDGSFDEDLVPPGPYANSLTVCDGYNGWTLICSDGWFDTDATLVTGCEDDTP
jgi:hypothetical protein